MPVTISGTPCPRSVVTRPGYSLALTTNISPGLIPPRKWPSVLGRLHGRQMRRILPLKVDRMCLELAGATAAMATGKLGQ